MPQLKIHPTLQRLYESVGEHGDAAALEGYIGPAPSGRVRLYGSLQLGSCVEIPEQAILHHEEDEASGRTTLFVDPSANLTVMAIAKTTAAQLREQSLAQGIPGNEATAMGAQLKDDKPGGGGGESTEACIRKAQEKCLLDLVIHGTPPWRAAIVCAQTNWLIKILCQNRPMGGGISIG